MDGLKGLDTRAPLQLDSGFRFCLQLVLESRSVETRHQVQRKTASSKNISQVNWKGFGRLAKTLVRNTREAGEGRREWSRCARSLLLRVQNFGARDLAFGLSGAKLSGSAVLLGSEEQSFGLRGAFGLKETLLDLGERPWRKNSMKKPPNIVVCLVYWVVERTVLPQPQLGTDRFGSGS